jgi:hypothetical protein
LQTSSDAAAMLFAARLSHFQIGLAFQLIRRGKKPP